MASSLYTIEACEIKDDTRLFLLMRCGVPGRICGARLWSGAVVKGFV